VVDLRLVGSPAHGGDLAFATLHYGAPERGWLDLSTGINPRPYPAPTFEATALARLPGRETLKQLTDAARSAYGVADGAALIATPGSEIALRLLPFLAPAGRVAVVAPTYDSHAEAWRAAGRDVSEISTVDEFPADVAILVLANPNNPDGRAIGGETLARLAHRLAARGGLLVVDEAFADLIPELSLLPHLGALPAVVLRSFGKFFGLAGLRLGFVAGPEPLLGRLAGTLGDWPVSNAALIVGAAALADGAWQENSRRQLHEIAAGLRGLLAGHGLRVAGGTDLFVLAEIGDAAALHHELAKRGVWTRAFARRPQWLRFGLPPDRDALDRLDAALTAALAALPARVE
jgi:cobalamin biosynthetic protein CobC